MAHTYEISGTDNKIILFDDDGREYPLDENIPGLNIRVTGNNNTIRIHKKTIFQASDMVITNDMAEIEIMESDWLCILVGMSAGRAQKLHIGRGTRIGGAHFVLAENGEIFVGDDCLFSDGIRFMAADGHTLIDKDTHEILNMPSPIVIGNHCWIGHGCMVTKGASMANDSVLGLHAILTRRITTPNVALAGVPARIVRKNINWSNDQILTLKSRDWDEAAADKDIIITFASSDYYVPYLGVALTSLIQHASSSKNYKIFIMETDITETNKARLQSIAGTRRNISIEFKNVASDIKDIDFVTHGHLSHQTFFKLLIPTIFREYKRVLFCDSDIIFMDDPAQLFLTDMGDKKIGAGLCHLWNGMANMRPECMEYARNELKLCNTDNYFQCGILLFNNTRISDDDTRKLIDIANGHMYQFLDQDVLNIYFQNDVHLFDSAWNYETPQRSFRQTNKFMSPKNASQYAVAGAAPRIIHYSGPHKPWDYTDEIRAADWWHYARQSVFYEDLLARRARDVAILVAAQTHIHRLRLKRTLYRVMRHLVSGGRQKKLRAKYDKINALVQRAANGN